MHTHASPEEQRILNEAAELPSLLDEKKFLEERRRRLEASLHGHVLELRDRGEQAGKIALAGAGALLGVWLVAKAIGSVAGARKHKKERALKTPVRLSALGPGAPGTGGPRERGQERERARGEQRAPERPALSHDSHAAPQFASTSNREETRRAARPPAPPAPPQPAGLSLFQTFMESEAGRMMTNQLVALLMVFITRKVEQVLQIERDADIGAVKESDLTPYRIVDPVSDATVVPDDPAPAAEFARPNAAASPSPSA